MEKIYLVGGAIRDKIMGLQSKDKDYVVECESFDAMRQLILNRGGKIFLETPKFLTIRALMPELGAADYVLARKDGVYKDGRHPESVEVGTIQDDLARRDFTMNAIAKNVETGELIDPHGGATDIENKRIRCVGNPTERFNEDKLRVFRALRFAITKDFTIDPETHLAMIETQDFSGVSTERIREELAKMFKYDSETTMLHICCEYDNLRRVIFERGIWFKPTTETT